MLTNSIPIERVFHNDKMWYEYVGNDEKGNPIIKEIPSGVKSILDNKHYYLSDDKEELYNYWIEVNSNFTKYEVMNKKYSDLFIEFQKKHKKSIEEYFDWNIIPLFRYYSALRKVKKITREQMLDGVISEIDSILDNLTIGKTMSDWSKDAHWTDVIADVKFDKIEKILKVKCVSFLAMHHYTRELREKIFDLKTEEGFYNLGSWLKWDRGCWKSLDELIENYEQHLAKIKTFISNVKKINSKLKYRNT